MLVSDSASGDSLCDNHVLARAIRTVTRYQVRRGATLRAIVPLVRLLFQVGYLLLEQVIVVNCRRHCFDLST